MSTYCVGRCFFGRGQPVVVLRLRRPAKPRRERALCRRLSPQKKADMTILGVITTSPASPIIFAEWWLLSGRPQVTFRNTFPAVCDDLSQVVLAVQRGGLARLQTSTASQQSIQ